MNKKLGISLVIVILLAFFAISCVGVTSSTLTDVKNKPGKRVEARTSASGILALTSPNPADLEEAAMKDLLSQCPGEVINITSRLQMRNFFIVQMYAVVVSGTCVEAGK